MSTFFNNFFGVKFLVEKAINAMYVARQQRFAFQLGRLCKQIAYLHSVPLLFRLWCGRIKIETSVFCVILAVCFRRSAFRAHFSPREILFLPTAMTFARKIRRYRFRCIVLACKPAWRYGFTYGVGGYPILVSRAASGRRCRDAHQERRAE